MATWAKAVNIATTNQSTDTKESNQIEYGNFDNADPELCVRLLHLPSLKNFSCLHVKLKSCKPEWLHEFVNQGGLNILLDSLDMMGEHVTFVDAFTKLECVRCVKEVMNSEAGLTAMLEVPGFVYSLARGKGFVEICVVSKQFVKLYPVCLYLSQRGMRFSWLKISYTFVDLPTIFCLHNFKLAVNMNKQTATKIFPKEINQLD